MSPVIRLIVDTGFAGARHEDEIDFPDDQWEAMSSEEREREMEMCLNDAVNNSIETWWEIVE